MQEEWIFPAPVDPGRSTVCESIGVRGQEEQVQGKPAWLELFLQNSFFNNCSVHHQLSKNEMNRYCKNCHLPICKYCVSSSGSCGGHNTLKMYRHVYHDTVLASDINKFIDCSKIQPFKCNKLWVLSLKPLPHNGSGSQTDAESACDICRRILSDPSLHRYCSLTCKVEAFSRKAKSSDPPFLEIGRRAANDDENAAAFSSNPTVNGEAEKRKRKKRKGTPQRAPLF